MGVFRSKPLPEEWVVVKVVPDTRKTKQGSDFVFEVDGDLCPELRVLRGTALHFDQTHQSNRGHPLYICSGPMGAGTNEMPSVKTRCSNNVLRVEIGRTAPDKLCYGCRNHGFEGSLIVVVD